MSDAVLTAIIESFFKFMMVFCICGTITETVGYIMISSQICNNEEKENNDEN